MPRGKKNRTKDNSRNLDLHEKRHQDVDRLVENHIFLTLHPHDIITGNSSEMQKIVIAVLERHNFKYQIGDRINKGYIRVLGY
jgi:hypothetical protein